MKLSGVEFSRVWNASGGRNFFGEGWWFHVPFRPFGLDYRGSTFVAKTTTLEPRRGNMPLRGTRLRKPFPSCIRVGFRKGVVLNAVGLSGPGAQELLKDGRWQSRLDPFFLSFMAVDADPEKRIGKAASFAEVVAANRRLFRAPFGIQLNVSCPNVGRVDMSGNYGTLVSEVRDTLRRVALRLPGVPLVPKINALMPVGVAREIATHPDCAAVCVSNTIPWGRLPDRIDWRGLFGSEVSPLASLGGGGLSGKPLLPIVLDWIARAVHGATAADILSDPWRSHRIRPADTFPVPIVGGDGILSKADALSMFAVGASAIELGSISILRPWRVGGIIRRIQRRQPWNSRSDAPTTSTSTSATAR
jgi:dihydroorotate dehydrogenase